MIKILHVDDNKDSLDAVAVGLDDKNIAIRSVLTIKDAKEYLYDLVPDILLVDIRLSNNPNDIEGLLFAIEVSKIEKFKKVKIIILSAYSTKEMLLKGYECKPIAYLLKESMNKNSNGNFRHVQKNFNIASLKNTINELLDEPEVENILKLSTGHIYNIDKKELSLRDVKVDINKPKQIELMDFIARNPYNYSKVNDIYNHLVATLGKEEAKTRDNVYKIIDAINTKANIIKKVKGQGVKPILANVTLPTEYKQPTVYAKEKIITRVIEIIKNGLNTINEELKKHNPDFSKIESEAHNIASGTLMQKEVSKTNISTLALDLESAAHKKTIEAVNSLSKKLNKEFIEFKKQYN